MTEVENLVLEHPKPFQAQTARVEDKVDQVAVDLRGVKQHRAAFTTSELRQDTDLASTKLRIERRLDLID